MAADVPSATVYVNNVNEKIRGEKLMQGLRQLFNPMGKIRKIHARRSLKLRGQAFVVFDRVNDAQNAIDKLQNFSFYGKPLRMAITQEPSDQTLRAQGVEPDRRPAHPKKGMVAVKLERTKGSGSRSVPTATPVAQPFAPSATLDVPPPPPQLPPARAHTNGGADPVASTGEGSGFVIPPAVAAPAPPYNVLFCEELPAEATEEMLVALFSQYAGFMGVRMVAARGCAFLDFKSEPEATVALHGLSGFKLTEERPLKLSYARQ